MEPRVSVVIPAYNISSYIRKAVESALGQTVADLEVLVVDDGSIDGTVERLAEIRDPRLRIFRREHAGVSQSRNFGIQMARAPYIGFLDGDDLWLSSKLEKHLEIMEIDSDTDLTFSLSRAIDSSGRDYGPPLPGSAEFISYQDLLRANPIRTASSVVTRKESLLKAGLFDPDVALCEDYDMWLRIANLRPKNLRCLREVLTLYRRRPGQLTGNWRALEASWIRMMEKARLSGNQEAGNAEPQARSRMYSYLAAIAYENKNFGEAFRLLGSAARSHPWTSLAGIRNWLLAIACLSGKILPSSLHQKLADTCMRWGRAISSRVASN